MTRDVEGLILALRHKNDNIRRDAAMALGEMGALRAVEPLIACLTDNNDYVAGYAALSLGKLQDKKAITSLTKALNDKKFFVRRMATQSLGLLSDKSSVEALIQTLVDKEESVRDDGAEALGKIGDSKALHALTEKLNDQSMRVRLSAINAITLINKNNLNAMESLLVALHSPGVEVRAGAAIAFDNIPDEIIRQRLGEANAIEIQSKSMVAKREFIDHIKHLLMGANPLFISSDVEHHIRENFKDLIAIVEQELRENIQIDAKNPVTHLALIGLLKLKGDYQEATNECLEALRLAPNNPRIVNTVRWCALDFPDTEQKRLFNELKRFGHA